ncbi:MAG: serine hydrolase domain-containing protein [Vicinamibacterales bacterium]
MRSTVWSASSVAIAAVVACALAPARPAAQAAAAAASPAAEVDRVFSRFSAATPGCAVGVGVNGAPVLARGYGTADLEHDVPIGPETIFEAGSVSKQFTAAAVMALVHDGRVSLDDPVRKYIPELPDYGTPLTIRHMLTHTSGLRDWGSLAGIAGWPRTTRVHTHAHVLEIVGRQKATNFVPGTHWSYSNTGYNLAAILVSRVSGRSFADFTKARLFDPLGMTKTSWRDDHTRIVKGRAIGYDETDGVFHTDMPFETVHGNGGLLTTVGDLLRWTEHLQHPAAGDAADVAAMQTPTAFSGGSGHGYGLGLMLDTRRGVRQIDHSGSTAGYLAHLVRYPDQGVAVAVLCNVDSAAATQKAYEVADLYLARTTTLAPPIAARHTLTAPELARVEGLYRSRLDGRPVAIVRDGATLRLDRGPALHAQSATQFETASGQSWTFDGTGHARSSDRYDVVDYDKVPAAAAPSAAARAALAGRYTSDEVETTLEVVDDGGTLVVTRRPDTRLPLTPVYADAFTAPGLGLVIVRRDAAGAVTALSVVQDRVWDLRFARQPAGATASR